jgi:myo-inositol 2-dehydrogenase / D-chiro-inositol 1-dehydrogenase
VTDSDLRCGVLGVGRIGRVHATNLARHVSGATLVALADPQPDLLAGLAADLGVSRTYADYRDLLAADDIDAVVVCTPTSTHFQVLMDAAASGKQMFAEKPVDLDLARIDEINAEVARRGLNMMVGFQRRYDPDFRRVRDVVRAGGVGDVHIVRISSRDASPPSRDFILSSGGMFLDMTVHDLDVVRFVTDSDVTGVFAKGAVLVDPMFAECGDWDTAVLTLTLANGALATIDNSRRATYGQDQRLEVFGSKGMVAVTNPAVDRVVSADAAGGHSSRLVDFFPQRYAEAYRLEMQAFVDALAAGSPMPVTGADGRRAVVIGMAARQSAAENRFVAIAG